MKKTILITGTSSGVGKATARHFAGQGWNVVATMFRPEKEAELAGLAGVLVTRLDVQDQASIAAAVEAGVTRFGRIDVLVNNAGSDRGEAIPPEKSGAQFDVNVSGVVDVVRMILPHFRTNQGGLILNIGSGVGELDLPVRSPCADKFTLDGFSEAISHELASQNIIVKIIEPGGVAGTKPGPGHGAEAAQNATLADCHAFIVQTQAVFAGRQSARQATAEEVAQVIYQAATDGTNRLRYVATADLPPPFKARRKPSETDYLALMRTRFSPRA